MTGWIVEKHVLNDQEDQERPLVTVTVWDNGTVDVQMTNKMTDPDTLAVIMQFVSHHGGTPGD